MFPEIFTYQAHNPSQSAFFFKGPQFLPYLFPLLQKTWITPALHQMRGSCAISWLCQVWELIAPSNAPSYSHGGCRGTPDRSEGCQVCKETPQLLKSLSFSLPKEVLVSKLQVWLLCGLVPAHGAFAVKVSEQLEINSIWYKDIVFCVVFYHTAL